jgi:hypothetical protein
MDQEEPWFAHPQGFREIDFLVADTDEAARSIETARGPYDAIVILHDVPALDYLMRQALGLLVPGGFLVVSGAYEPLAMLEAAVSLGYEALHALGWPVGTGSYTVVRKPR